MTNSAGQIFGWTRRPQSGWFHVVVNLVDDGEGFHIFHNGTNVANITNFHPNPHGYTGSGNIVLGQGLTRHGGDHASVVVDELLFFEQVLTTQQITALSQCPPN